MLSQGRNHDDKSYDDTWCYMIGEKMLSQGRKLYMVVIDDKNEKC